MGPDKDSLCTYNCIYFRPHQFKHVIETVPLSTHNICFGLKNKKNNFSVHTFIWGPDCQPISLIQSLQEQSFYFQLSA